MLMLTTNHQNTAIAYVDVVSHVHVCVLFWLGCSLAFAFTSGTNRMSEHRVSPYLHFFGEQG